MNSNTLLFVINFRCGLRRLLCLFLEVNGARSVLVFLLDGRFGLFASYAHLIIFAKLLIILHILFYLLEHVLEVVSLVWLGRLATIILLE